MSASFPTALAFAPDGRLFWAERTGTVKVWQGGAAHTFATVPASTSGERGLLGLALTPSFASDHLVYAFYSRSDDTTQQRIVRWTDCGGTATNYQVIVDNLPAGTSGNHKGGRIAFSPDGYLFATIGDNGVPDAAQDNCDARGKVLRFTASGQQAGGICGAVFAKGLRNPFGLAIAPDGTVAVTNNGPSRDNGIDCNACGDIFDIVGRDPGKVFQWPNCWGYNHQVSGRPSCAGMQGPNYSTEGGPYAKSDPYFIAPTGLTYANGHWLFCVNGSDKVYQYNFQGNVSDTGLGACWLDIKQATDGHLYTSSQNAITRH
jgi:glucose/arabinose dehydrogenase